MSSTALTGAITRVSSSTVDGREILITLTPEQTISMRLKGLKAAPLSISIQELWEQLAPGKKEEPQPPEKLRLDLAAFDEYNAKHRAPAGGDLISIHDLRHLNAVTKSSPEVLAKIDEICAELLERGKVQQPKPARQAKKEVDNG